MMDTVLNVGCEVAKQFLICLVVFEFEPLANQLLIQKKRARNLLKAIFALTMVHWCLLDNDIYSVFAVYTYIFLLASFISLQHICRMLVYYQSLFQVVFCIFFSIVFLKLFFPLTVKGLRRLLPKSGPRPWTRTLKNLDPKKPKSWETWTLENLEPRKTWPWKTWETPVCRKKDWKTC